MFGSAIFQPVFCSMLDESLVDFLKCKAVDMASQRLSLSLCHGLRCMPETQISIEDVLLAVGHKVE